jgi:phosphatidylinositol glycan class C protein
MGANTRTFCVYFMAKWEKLLWKKQPFADNYVDETFLELMRKNDNVKYHSLWEVVKDSGRVTQQTTVITIFIAIFMVLLDSNVSSIYILPVAILSVLMYMFLGSTLGHSLSNVLVFVMITGGLTPTLKDLTREISDDTIWAFTSAMFAANLVSHDYGSQISRTYPSLMQFP